MVLEKIIKMVAEQFMVSEDSVTADTAFVGDLGADSLDVVEEAGTRHFDWPKGSGMHVLINQLSRQVFLMTLPPGPGAWP